MQREIRITQHLPGHHDQIGLPSTSIASACAASVIIPTAAVSIPAARTRSANPTWYPGPTGIFACGTNPPDEQSTTSTPNPFNNAASRTESSTAHPPSAQSVAEMRTNKGYPAGQAARTASTTSVSSRTRFS